VAMWASCDATQRWMDRQPGSAPALRAGATWWTTSVTDVDNFDAGDDDALGQHVSRALALIARSRAVPVLTGAGISTDSRIPDFRGPQGVWTKNPGAEKLASLDHYLTDAEVRRRAWLNRLDSPVWSAEPNEGHRALLRLEAQRKLQLLITQNIDGLHHAAGSDPSRIVEIHGNAREVVCLSCEYRTGMVEVLDRVRAGEADPDCPWCGGILKSATISFGQNLVHEDLLRAERAARDCDLLLAVGSTLSVFPIANVVPVARRNGATVVIVNGSPTEMDDLAHVVVRGSISHLLPRILG
jgi:NAD-dependent deacetylase